MFFSKCKDQFFTVSCELDKINPCVATSKDLEWFSYLQVATTHNSNKTSTRELTNHNAANPQQELWPTISGMKKTLSNSVDFINTS